MLGFINRCVKAPLTYIADLRAISFKEYLLIATNFSPSYPIMIFTALGFTLMYCAILIYFVFTSSFSQSCYSGVHGAAYLIAILYPIESFLCFICLTGSIALSKSNCWRVMLMLVFGPVLCGFGYGEVGIIQLCLLSGNHKVFPMPSVVMQPGFVDAMVYLYISFLALYFILVPSINYLYGRQNADQAQPKAKQSKEGKQLEMEAEKKQPQSSCCSKIITILYYICNAFFVIAVLFILFIKLVGPILYTIVWVKMGANINDFTEPMEQFMFAGLILAYFAPIGAMFLTLAIQRLVKLGRGKKDKEGTKQTKQTKDVQTSARKTWQAEDPQIQIDQSLQSSKVSNSRKSVSIKHPQPVPPVPPAVQQKGEKKVGLL